MPLYCTLKSKSKDKTVVLSYQVINGKLKYLKRVLSSAMLIMQITSTRNVRQLRLARFSELFRLKQVFHVHFSAWKNVFP